MSGIDAAICRAEENYWENLVLRRKACKGMLYPPPASMTDVVMKTLVLIPTYPCPANERIGEWGDGGKWTCLLPGAIQKNPIVYSIGSFGQYSFEDSIYKILDVQPHTFDPFLVPTTAARMQNVSCLHFHPIGLSANSELQNYTAKFPTMQFMTLEGIMQLLNHSYVDIFKIDCEGCEEALIPEIGEANGNAAAQLSVHGGTLPFGQILVEFHKMNLPQVTLPLVYTLEKLGYRMFSIEYRNSHAVAMPRKRKGQDRDDCPNDLNEIPYIRWMNQQIANGRHPTGLSSPVAPDPQDSSAQTPRAGPSRVRRQPTRSAAVQRPAYELEEEESHSEYRGDAVGTDDDDDKEDDLGMSEDEEVDNEDDDVAEEDTQPVTPPPKRNASKTTGAVKRKGKAPVEEPRLEPRKKQSTAPRVKSMWSDRKSTIFVAAKWFTKDEFQPLKGKQGTQYWARLLAHIKEENPDWIRGINALQKQWRNLMLLLEGIGQRQPSTALRCICTTPRSPRASARLGRCGPGP
ncbi:unnamed protein product [Closterium sp. NIES-54]